MDAVELLLPESKPSGVWMCRKCRVLAASCHSPVQVGDRETTWEEKSESARKRAERCCNPTCDKCGAKCRPEYRLCEPCDALKRAEDARRREARLFEKATKLTVDEWGKSDAAEWLFDDRCDKWFRDLDEAEEWYADDEERERPAYLWCSVPIRWKPHASDDIASQMHDHFHEDASDDIPDAEWKRLDAFVNEWWAEQGVVSFEPDFSRCVLLPPLASATTEVA